MLDDEIDDDYQNKKRKPLETKKHSRRRLRFCDSCIEGCRKCPKLGNGGNVGRRPNVDRKKCKLVKCL